MLTCSNSVDWEYDYDPFGRRVLKDIDEGEEVTRYVYDGPHCIAEYNGAGTLLRKYVYGPGIDEALMMINVSGQTQTKYYYHRDALGNVMALSEGTGFIVEGYTYSAFGMAIVNTTPGTDGDWLTPDGATSPISAFGNPYMFTGRRYDWETGLYYYRARYYDATLGRFISADPISYAGGINLYAYVNNNPINSIDSFGTCVMVVPIDISIYGNTTNQEEPEENNTCDGRWLPVVGYGLWEYHDDKYGHHGPDGKDPPHRQFRYRGRLVSRRVYPDGTQSPHGPGIDMDVPPGVINALPPMEVTSVCEITAEDVAKGAAVVGGGVAIYVIGKKIIGGILAVFGGPAAPIGGVLILTP